MVAVIIAVLLAWDFSESKNKEGSITMKYQYIIVYYVNPLIMHYVPVTKDDIEERCLSKIIIGNKQEIEKIRRILTSIRKEQEHSEGIIDSLTFKIKIKYPNIREEIWFVDKSRNFELNAKDRGKIPIRYFKKLVDLFDIYSEIIDLKYWKKFQSSFDEGK